MKFAVGTVLKDNEKSVMDRTWTKKDEGWLCDNGTLCDWLSDDDMQKYIDEDYIFVSFDPTQPKEELLSQYEHDAMDLLTKVDFLLTEKIIGYGSTRTGDVTEITNMIHYIQSAIMSQAAARAYPNLYRRLGE